jgi:AAA domain
MNCSWKNSENSNQKKRREMNETERIALVEHIRILYPRLQQLFEHMDLCAQSVTEASQHLTQYPLNMAVAGQAGVGKTVLAQIWLSEAMRKLQVGETIPSSPYRYIRLPAMITQKSLLYHLLCTATDFRSNRQLGVTNTWNMENFFFQVLPASGIHMIILDNCEYLIRNQSMHTTSALIEFLVRMTYQRDLSLILLGTLAAMEHIMEVFPKFERHFGPLLHLAPFGWDRAHPETLMEWQTLLTTLDHELPFDETALAAEDLGYRVFYATDGILGRLMQLLFVAAEKAIHEASTTLSLCDLAYAYNLCIAETSIGQGKVNPFSTSDFTEMGA